MTLFTAPSVGLSAVFLAYYVHYCNDRGKSALTEAGVWGYLDLKTRVTLCIKRPMCRGNGGICLPLSDIA